MNRYAASVVATQDSNVRHGVFMLEAQSEAEAEGIGMRIARKLYPQSNGWKNHHVMVCGQDRILTVANAVIVPEEN